jgi:hypothetical protein
VRLRRKSTESTDAQDVADAGTDAATDERDPGDRAAAGPYDADDAPEGVERVDLGSLLIAPPEGYELRLQVDENSGIVQSVVLAGQEGVVELRAFAAPRNGDFWEDARSQIAADISRRGGTATAREGRWGPELICQLPVRAADGRNGTQVSRVLGVNGPRWLLRATLLGAPAVNPEENAEWEDIISDVVVVRGAQAAPPGEALAVTMPAQARRAES